MKLLKELLIASALVAVIVGGIGARAMIQQHEASVAVERACGQHSLVLC